jgi:hypothetical protein
LAQDLTLRKIVDDLLCLVKPLMCPTVRCEEIQDIGARQRKQKDWCFDASYARRRVCASSWAACHHRRLVLYVPVGVPLD